jgi:hypothetical protein
MRVDVVAREKALRSRLAPVQRPFVDTLLRGDAIPMYSASLLERLQGVRKVSSATAPLPCPL